MKRTKAATLAALALTALSLSCTVRQYPTETRSVHVRGYGSVAVEADRSLIQLSVISHAKEAGAAAALNAQTMTNVQAAIVAAGCPKDAISTENYSIYQESNYENGKRIMGDYRVSNDIKVFLKDMELVSTIIDTAIKAGANSLSSLTFSVSNPEAAIRKAREKAVLDAHAAARLIADTAGAKLGNVIQINELYDNYARPIMAKATSNALYEARDADEGANTPVSSGKINFDVTVDASFELK